MRKRSKEARQGSSMPLFETERKTRRTGRIVVYGIIIPFLAVSFAGVLWVWQEFIRSDYFGDSPASGIGLRVPTPEPALLDPNNAKPIEPVDSPPPEKIVAIDSSQTFDESTAEGIPQVSEPEKDPEVVEMTVSSESKTPPAPLPAPSQPVEPKLAGTRSKQVPETPASPEKAVPVIVDPPKQTRKESSKKNIEQTKPLPEQNIAPVKQEPPGYLFFRKGVVYHRQNRLNRAIDMYREALKANPGHLHSLINISAAYIQIGAFAEANLILHRMMVNQPDHPEILMNLAISEIGLKKPETAVYYLGRIPESDTHKVFTVYFHKGVAFSQLGDLEQAMKWYGKAEAEHPDHPQLIYNMAVLHDKSGNYRDALRYYQLRLTQGDIADLRPSISKRINSISAYLANSQN